MISFHPTILEDVAQMHAWFNEAHVQRFYSLRAWSESDVLNKLAPIIDQKKPLYGFIAKLEGKPVGYLQYCKVIDYPWPQQDLDKTILNEAVGLDLFIGDPNLIGKGIGAQIVNKFLEVYIWPYFHYCVVDPDERNLASIRMFEKCGFLIHKKINTHNTLKKPVTLVLMIKENQNEI